MVTGPEQGVTEAEVERPGLAPEVGPQRRLLGHLRGEHLDHHPLAAGVARQADGPHAAPPRQPLDPRPGQGPGLQLVGQLAPAPAARSRPPGARGILEGRPETG